MLCKLFTEILIIPRITVIVFTAPCLINLEDPPGCAVIVDLAVFPRAHTFLKKCDHGAVGALIAFPRLYHAFGFRESVAVCDDGLQGLDRFIDNTDTLRIHLVEKPLILSVFRDNICDNTVVTNKLVKSSCDNI